MAQHKSRATDYAKIWKYKWRDINPGLQTTQKCQIEIFSNISNKNLDRKEYQRKIAHNGKSQKKLRKNMIN